MAPDDVALPLAEGPQLDALAAAGVAGAGGAAEIPAAKVSLLNPAWSAALERARPMLAAKLSVVGTDIALDLRALVVCRAGAQYVPPPPPRGRAFAALVVQLPYAHAGGRLLVRRPDGDAVHDFGQDDASGRSACHYAAHYAGADCAYAPVESGVWLALAYDVLWPEGHAYPAPKAGTTSQQRMARLLRDLGIANRQFHYFLSHDYDDRALEAQRAAALRGTDRTRVAALREANDLLEPADRFMFFLGRAKQSHYYWSLLGQDPDDFFARFEDGELEPEEVSSALFALVDVEGRLPVFGSDSLDSWADRRLQAPLPDADALNPERRSSAQLWDGICVIGEDEDPDYGCGAKEKAYFKNVLLAWPAGSVADMLSDLAGEQTAFNALAGPAPTAEHLQGVLRRFATRRARQLGEQVADVERRCAGNPLAPARLGLPDGPVSSAAGRFRHAVFEAVMRQPPGGDRARLGELYIRVFSSARQLLASTGDADAWTDMVALVQTDDVWPTIRTTLVSLLAGHPLEAYRFLRECLLARVPADRWDDARASAVRAVPPDIETFSNDEQAAIDMWRTALELDTTDLCRTLVGRYLASPPLLHYHPAVALRSLHDLEPRLFTPAACAVLAPLLERRIAAASEQRRKIAEVAVPSNWRFPGARFPADRAVEAFLHGDARSMTVTGMRSLPDARMWASNNQDYGMVGEGWRRHGRDREATRRLTKGIVYADDGLASFTLQAGGRGEDACVTVTKTRVYFDELRSTANMLADETAALRAIVATSAVKDEGGGRDGIVKVEDEGAGAVHGQGDAFDDHGSEPERKKARMSS